MVFSRFLQRGYNMKGSLSRHAFSGSQAIQGKEVRTPGPPTKATWPPLMGPTWLSAENVRRKVHPSTISQWKKRLYYVPFIFMNFHGFLGLKPIRTSLCNNPFQTIYIQRCHCLCFVCMAFGHVSRILDTKEDQEDPTSFEARAEVCQDHQDGVFRQTP